LLAGLQLHALTSVAELHPQMAANSLVTKPRALECHGPPRLNRIDPESLKSTFVTIRYLRCRLKVGTYLVVKTSLGLSQIEILKNKGDKHLNFFSKSKIWGNFWGFGVLILACK
jgi:hypothetical protein